MKAIIEGRSRKKGMVKIRGGFSDTNGISPYHTVLQTEEFDDDTRMMISNLLYDLVNVALVSFAFVKGDRFLKSIINNVFHESTKYDCKYNNWDSLYIRINDVINNAEYNEVLDVVEYLCRLIDRQDIPETQKPFYYFNNLFENESVGYRFVAGRIVRIIDKQEIDAIEAACTNPFDGCRKQIQKAVDFLADREGKDYKNCIKESISAVESACQIIVGNEKATLSDAIRNLEKNGVEIHPALKEAFKKLYAYTSDKGGIRHAEGMFESNVTFEEAKYMLVSCSAFINYLVSAYVKRST